MLTLTLALRDLMRDRFFLLCNVAVLCGVLVPLLILFGVKNGIYQALIGDLLRNPATLQIDTQGNASLTEADIAPLRSDPGIAFLTPRTRSQFDYIFVHNAASKGAALREALLLPSGDGDPNLPAGVTLAADEVALSAALARQLNVAPGAALALVTQAEGRPRQLRLPVRVRLILPDAVSTGSSVLAPFAIPDLIEAFYDAYALPDLGITDGRPLSDRVARHEGLRVYARSLEELAAVQSRVERQLGVATSARTREVAAVLGLGRNLERALALTVGLACLGLAAALIFSFWSDVMRKRTALAALGMLGMPPRRLALFPIVQGVVTAGLGLAASFGMYALAARAAKAMFGAGMPSEGQVAVISASQAAGICLAVLGLVILAAAAAAWSVQRIDPAQTLREGQ